MQLLPFNAVRALDNLFSWRNCPNTPVWWWHSLCLQVNDYHSSLVSCCISIIICHHCLWLLVSSALNSKIAVICISALTVILKLDSHASAMKLPLLQMLLRSITILDGRYRPKVAKSRLVKSAGSPGVILPFTHCDGQYHHATSSKTFGSLYSL